MKNLNNNWHIFNNRESLSKQLAEEVLRIAKKSIQKKDTFSMVLTGGQSSLDLYKILSKANSSWSKWHLYITDERLLPDDYPERNDRVIKKIWLDDSAIPKQNIHFIRAEVGLLEAQQEYEDMNDASDEDVMFPSSIDKKRTKPKYKMSPFTLDRFVRK